MRLLLFAIAAMTVAGGQAFAYYCSEPSKPSIPNGYYAERYELESAQEAVDRYIDAVNDYIECLNREAEDVRDEARRVVRELDEAISEYNNRQ